MPNSNSPSRSSRQSFKGWAWSQLKIFFLVVLAIIVMYSIGLLVLDNVSLETVHTLQTKLHKFDRVWMFFRWIFIAVLCIYWIPINTNLARKKAWSQAYLENVISKRYVVLALLIGAELVLVQSISIQWAF